MAHLDFKLRPCSWQTCAKLWASWYLMRCNADWWIHHFDLDWDHQLWDGLQWTFLQMTTVTRRWLLMTWVTVWVPPLQVKSYSLSSETKIASGSHCLKRMNLFSYSAIIRSKFQFPKYFSLHVSMLSALIQPYSHSTGIMVTSGNL